jgi:hypothetical protein
MSSRDRLIAVAAAVVTAMGLVGCQSGAGAPSAGTSSTPAAAAAASDGPALCETTEPGCLGLLAPGTHRTSNLITPLSYTVPAGWDKTLDVPGSFNLEDPSDRNKFLAVWPDFVIASQSACTGAAEPGIGRTASDLVGWLTAHPGLVTTEPARVTLGGLEGQALVVRKDAQWTSGTCPGAVNLFTHDGTINDPGWERLDDATTFRLTILDTADGHTVMIGLIASHAAIDAFAEATAPIIASFDFTP